jgi:hypothetical protein
MKNIFLLLFILLSVTSVQAQNFDFTLSGGFTMCQIDGDNSAHYNHIGYHAGVSTSFPLGDRKSDWRMLVEIGVIQKGSEVNNSKITDRSVALNYVHLPLLVTYNIDLDKKRDLRLGAGVAPAILFRAHVDDSGVESVELQDKFRRMDVLPICIDATFMFSKHLGVNARFYNSLIGISQESREGTYRITRSNKGIFSKLLAFGINYRF